MIKRLKNDKIFRTNALTLSASVINIVYAASNLAMGISEHSYWFVTLGVYFTILSIMRLVCLKAANRKKRTVLTCRFIGIMLVALCITLGTSVALSHKLDVVAPVRPVAMIVIASYTMVKTVLAMTSSIKARKGGNRLWVALRNISCADAGASVLSMQRSVLLSIKTMPVWQIKQLNLLTGGAVCFFILVLGWELLFFSKNTQTHS